jgi:hypothetical protein
VSTCSKCNANLANGAHTECADEDTPYSEAGAYQDCLERQLSNLRSLLRSVTGKLESAREYLDGAVDRYAAEAAAAEIDAVLEVLS